MERVRIGCSGWAYKDWTGPFYPPGTKDRDRLAYYAGIFDTAEINASFYRLPSEAAVAAWAENAPAGFIFAWKVSRFISHNKKLKECGDSIALVYGRMAGLGVHAGPALIQLPPQLRRNDERLAGFLDLLPPGRHTVEFRDPSWYAPEVFDILRARNVALCFSDHHNAPAPWVETADWVYVRGHGPGGRYYGRYDPQTLKIWAERLRDWQDRGMAAYCYFDNDIKSAAPADAQVLKGLVEGVGLRPAAQ